MAEGLLGGFLGGEEEGPEAEAPAEARVGGEAFAAALAVDHAKHDPGVARAIRLFLARQARLLAAQTRELTDQHALRLSQLRGQSREAGLRRIGQRIRLATQFFFVLIFTVIGLGLLVMVHDAFTSQSVVVEPFDAPPALAERGLTGKVVAGSLLDDLSRLQAATRSATSKRQLSNAWTSEVKVEVPETGISIGEIDRLLKSRFGHDVRIGGELVQTDAGQLALTVRGEGILAKTFTGAPGELDKLTTEAAEYLYGQSQPATYANYLSNQGRNQEAVAFAQAAYPRIQDDEEKAYLLNGWGNSLQSIGAPVAESLMLYQSAVKLKPDFWTGYSNVTNVQILLGREEDAWRTMEALQKRAGRRPGKAREVLYQNEDLLTWNLQAWRAAQAADAAQHGGVGSAVSANGPAIADIDARLHDPVDAEFQLRTALGDPHDPTIAAIGHFVRGWLAAEAGDVRRAAAEMEAFGVAFSNPIVSSNYGGYTCWIAPAEEAAGRPDKADAVLKAGGRYVDCYRFRGDLLDHRGDWAGAQKAYAEAVAIAPDLPAGYYSWGLALARHGDLTGAVGKLAAANQRGPHWADPLKAWGDVLARQGRWKAALAKYDEALKYAPAWAELQQVRRGAAQHKS